MAIADGGGGDAQVRIRDTDEGRLSLDMCLVGGSRGCWLRPERGRVVRGEENELLSAFWVLTDNERTSGRRDEPVIVDRTKMRSKTSRLFAAVLSYYEARIGGLPCFLEGATLCAAAAE